MGMTPVTKVSAAASLKIVVPTFNSARYLDIILSYYLKHDIPVEVLVDSKSNDQSKKVAAAFCSSSELFNADCFIEKVVGDFSRAVGTSWILRIDDDELPSLEMMRFIESLLASPASENIDVVGFPRHQCLVTGDGRLWDCTKHSATTVHRQWRLYRPDRIAYHANLHTPGFDVVGGRCFKAPDDACMIHLDWAVHSQTERRRKFERYEEIAPGHLANVKDYYLFEAASDVSEHLIPFDRPEFVDVGRKLAARGCSVSAHFLALAL